VTSQDIDWIIRELIWRDYFPSEVAALSLAAATDRHWNKTRRNTTHFLLNSTSRAEKRLVRLWPYTTFSRNFKPRLPSTTNASSGTWLLSFPVRPERRSKKD
jgi:hypothetical protein